MAKTSTDNLGPAASNFGPGAGGLTEAEVKSFSSRPPGEMDTVCPACGGALVLICSPSLLVRLQGEKITALQREIDRLRRCEGGLEARLAHLEAALAENSFVEAAGARRPRRMNESRK